MCVLRRTEFLCSASLLDPPIYPLCVLTLFFLFLLQIRLVFFLLVSSSNKKKRGKKLASRRVFSSEKSPLQGVRGLSSPPRICGGEYNWVEHWRTKPRCSESSVPQSTGPLISDRFGSVQENDGYGPRAEYDYPLPRSTNGRSKTVIHRFHNRWPVHWLIQFRLKVLGSFLSRCRIPLCLGLCLA